MSYSPGISGSFIPTTFIWDVSRIHEIEVNSPEFKELLVRLYQNLNNMALSLNSRDAGYYDVHEFVNGQLYFPNPAYTSLSGTTPVYRQVIRKVINFGALPNTTTKSVPHNISIVPTTTFTRIYGTSNDLTDEIFIPLPYASSTAADNIELNVDFTNVNIITGSDRSAFTITYVVLEFLQN